MKLITIIGARPQFIKSALISKQLNKKNHYKEIVIHTGQHFDSNMSNIFFEELENSESESLSSSAPLPCYLLVPSVKSGCPTSSLILTQ